MKNVLVLGGTGYLGEKVVKVIRKTEKVYCTVRRCMKAPVEGVEYIKSDIRAIEEVLKKNKIDLVLNMACSYDRGLLSYQDVIESNISFPLSVLNTAVKFGVKDFITIGTGLPDDFNIYSVSKKCFSDFGQFYSKKHSINFVNLKLEMFYGADEPKDRFIACVADKLLKNEEIDLTEGTQKRDIIHVEDACRAIIKMIGESVNGYLEMPIGTGYAPTIREIVSYMAKLANSKSVLNWGKVPMRKGGEPDCIADLSILSQYGIVIESDWKKGLKKMFDELKEVEII